MMDIEDIAREFADERIDVDDDLVAKPHWFWKLLLLAWAFS